MSKENNRIKDRLLGMPHGTANNKLKKSIIFELATRLKMTACMRCGSTINSIDDMSIDHIHAWQSSPYPKVAFFDLTNIAFSHLSCNISAKTTPNKILPPKGKRWCGSCESFQDLKKFYDNHSKNRCKDCHNTVKTKWREKTGKH